MSLLGIEDLRFHDLRHTFATRAVELGSPIVAISKIPGHQDLKTTMRYSHPEDSLRETVKKLESYSHTDSQTDTLENR